MAVKICPKCFTPRTVQPRADNRISYWKYPCMKCAGQQQELKCTEVRLLKLITVTQSLRAA